MIAEAAMVLALLMHRPEPLVRTVYKMAGLDGVAVVWMESRFVPTAVNRREPGGTSYGLWQLYSRAHPQYREDLLLHAAYGAAFWHGCMSATGGNFTMAVRIYNSGSTRGGVAWADRVREKRDDLALYVWRHLR